MDLHCHVLPGIDDGPADMAAAVALARAAADGGISVLAATPHLRADHPAVRAEELGWRTEQLREALAAREVAIEVCPAAEVDLYWAGGADDATLRLASYGQRGTDLLLEVPYGELPPIFEDLLFQLIARGYRLLLAHPERSPTFQRDPARLLALVEHGVLVQVTAAAVMPGTGRSRSRRLARALVTRGAAHVISSDAHGTHVDRATLRDGRDAAAHLVGARAEWMVADAPAAILEGRPLPPLPPDERPWWRRAAARRPIRS